MVRGAEGALCTRQGSRNCPLVNQSLHGPLLWADGLPICFSWPVLPSTISKEAFQVRLSNGSVVTPDCIGINPNLEFNERQARSGWDAVWHAKAPRPARTCTRTCTRTRRLQPRL